MRKLVKLSLEGNINSGYEVKLLEIKEEGKDGSNLAEGGKGYLPPAQGIYQKYQEWQQKYEQLDLVSRKPRLRQDVELPTEVSIEDFQKLTNQLKKEINQWLDDSGFHQIENTIRDNLNRSDQIRFIIKTTDRFLWQLPWAVWDFFESFSNAEVVFSPSEARGFETSVSAVPKNKVRILATFGDSQGLDLKKDREIINRLRSVGAKPKFLTEPTKEKVRNLLWNQQWDIFFFAGHSDRKSDKQTGIMYINSKETLKPEELESTLKVAIDNGLKIAVLNSCHSLVLARQLVDDFGIPLVIAMRDEVPNQVAQQFLEYFLLEYAYRKQPLYVAVRKARERILENWQEQLPSVDWLPVICQNPAIRPPTWQELYRPVSIRQVGVASLACTSLVMLVRFFGLLQQLELSAFDKLMQMRPVTEPPDKRLLIVKVTERDIKIKNEYPISDRTVEQVLRKLEQYQPRVIGLDIYRDSNRYGDVAGHEALLKYLKESDRVVATCRLEEPMSKNSDDVGVKPPPGVPQERIGFAELPKDKDRVTRLQFLGMEPSEKDPCQTPHSLSFELALKYLERENSIKLEPYQDEDSLHLPKQGGIVFQFLKPHTGGYQKLDEEEIGGRQVLLNYRASHQIADEVSLTDVLNNRIDPNLVINRAVLIGYTAESTKEDYSTSINPKMPGVMIHAHGVSQILSSILDKRSLLWVWPLWGDFLWVLGWSLLGGLLVWQIQKPFFLILAEGIVFIALPISCLIILIQGGWMALIPSVFALVFTIGGLLACIIYPTWKQN